MSLPVLTDASVSICASSDFGANKTISGVTLGATTSIAATAHGLSANDYVVFHTPGVPVIHEKVFKVLSATTDALVIDLDTSFATAGKNVFSTGNLNEVVFTTNASTLFEVTFTGGDPKKIDVTTIHDASDKEKVISATASGLDMTAVISPDDPFDVAFKVEASGRKFVALRTIADDGTEFLAAGTAYYTSAPKGGKQQLMTHMMGLSGIADFTQYAG